VPSGPPELAKYMIPTSVQSVKTCECWGVVMVGVGEEEGEDVTCENDRSVSIWAKVDFLHMQGLGRAVLRHSMCAPSGSSSRRSHYFFC
jgi:hypothetical protein